ncbi:MAG: hypothetical protein AAGJ40_16150 [Planctomycetota bacterium]
MSLLQPSDSIASTFTPSAESPTQRPVDADGRPVDRRGLSGRQRVGQNERRQFGSSHSDLSDEGRELAAAIDAYKIAHHRRYITCDEMLTVLHELGYGKLSAAS